MLFEAKGRIAPPSITVVVTYDDCKLVRELYGKYRIVSVENSSGNNASKAELFITSGGI